MIHKQDKKQGITQAESLKTDPVLFVRVASNAMIPSFSEMEILGTIMGQAPDKSYLLQGQLKISDLMIAAAVVTPGDSIPIRVMNPTGQSVMLYKGTKVASLSGIDEVIPGEQSVPVSSVHQRCDDTSAMLEEPFQSLLENVPLTSDQQNVLFSLLMEYADVFAISDDQLGRTNVLQHEIHTEDVSPICQRFRRMSPQKREEMQKLLSDMLAKNIISPSKSPWASPVVLVKKKDGTSRFCVDYRQVNAVTRKDAFPLPRVDDTLDILAGSQLFSTLDLISGYWQVEVKPEDREKTAFATSERLYEFNVLPFGMCNGPATFQRLMNILLAGIQWHSCLVYLDDIIVLGRSFEEHIQNLAQVFQRLRDANLKLQIKSAHFVEIL